MGIADQGTASAAHFIFPSFGAEFCFAAWLRKKEPRGAAIRNSNRKAPHAAISREVMNMDDFQKQMSRFRRNRAFADAFDKKRAEAEVAFQIRRLREAKGWIQKDLAKKAGCSQQAISAIEQIGYRRHSLPLLRRIAQVLGADVIVALIPRKAA